MEYQLCTPEKIDVVQVTNFTEKMQKVVFDPHLTPRDKNKIPKIWGQCAS